MSSFNEQAGMARAGKRARMASLSGVQCPNCPHRDVVSNVVSRRRLWMCGWCSFMWEPTQAEVEAYNARVRDRDRIAV